MSIKETFQVVNWYPDWQGMGIEICHEDDPGPMKYIYDWCVWAGYWEIRKWKRIQK